ncbi:MATE family efflux transporter [Acuticoccus sp.]|uniref:MATE family efflux transporter n=1 Tax=Acuticoccus sp. TaxID=1904378 RepID=UPI003B52DBD8
MSTADADPRHFTVSLRMVFAIAVPMTLAYLSTPLIGVVDVAVVGQLGDAALIGAVALGALLFDFIGTSFNFLRSGTTGLVAQAMGAGDREAEAITLWRALLFATVAGTAVIALHQPLLFVFLEAMGASEAVDAATARYYAVRVWGTPLMFANYAILGWLLGLARAGTGLGLQVMLGVTNIALSLLFVLGLGWGVAGVAAASVIAEGVTLAAGAAVVARALGRRPRPTLAAVLERIGFLRMVLVNRDIFIRSMLLVGTFSFFNAVSARTGDVTLAANAILMNVFLLASYFLDGLATASEQLGGRAVGARLRTAFDRTVRVTLIAGVTLAAGLSALALVAGPAFIDAMTTSEPVRSEARLYVAWAALTPVAGAVAFIMDGLFIGATWTVAMRNMMILSTLLFLAVWAVATPTLGNHGLWLALLAFLGARGLTLWLAVPRHARRTFGVPASSR